MLGLVFVLACIIRAWWRRRPSVRTSCWVVPGYAVTPLINHAMQITLLPAFLRRDFSPDLMKKIIDHYVEANQVR